LTIAQNQTEEFKHLKKDKIIFCFRRGVMGGVSPRPNYGKVNWVGCEFLNKKI